MTRVAILGGGPAAILAALLAHRAGAEVRWVSAATDAPQSPHIHVLRAEIGPSLAKIDARLGGLIAAVTEKSHLWRSADGATQCAPRMTRAGLMTALRARLAEDGLHPVTGNAEDLVAMSKGDQGAKWIDATGGARALARLFEDRGHGRLQLEDVGRPCVWTTRYWSEYDCAAAFTYVVPAQHYVEASCDGLRTTGCGEPGVGHPAWINVPQLPPTMTWRFIAPPIRRAIWKPSLDAPRLILLGDALLQTPPAMGFGLLAVAQQATILSKCLHDWAYCDAELDRWAKSVWTSAALQDAIQSLPV